MTVGANTSPVNETVVPTQRTRVTASELVEYVLYLYAMLHFVWITMVDRDVFSSGLGIAGTYVLAVTFFLFVLLRNYLVMHAIDTAEHRYDRRFEFLSGNQKASDVVERIIRFSIL